MERFLELVRSVSVAADAEYLYGDDPEGRRRERNLRRYFDAVADAPLILVGEAPGWRGMTVSGVPFVSAREAEAGVIPGLELPAEPQAPWEASSRVVWAALARWQGPLPVSWPIFPHHPFVAGDPRTNRTPRPAEVRDGTSAAVELARAMGIRMFVAVGRKAQGALAAHGIESIAIRHPAQGGARMFTEQLLELNRAISASR